MTASSVPARFGACLALLFLLSITPALAAATQPAAPATAPAASTTAASAAPTPVVLDGKIPLPADVPPAPALADVSSYVLMDYATGTVIAAKAPHVHLAPASLTKLMTVFLTYQALKAGTVKMDRVVPVSVAAWKAGGSRMFIQPGLPVTTRQLIAGLMVDSGNDAAVALSQAVAGTQASFVTMMNHTAGLLHLADTHYVNVDGLPADDHYTSAFDLARLSRVIIESYPDVLKIAGQQYYTYNKIRQPNWNPLVFRDATVDGLKTGLTDASGHCIDATAVRSGRRLIAVVMGGPSWKASADDIEALLDYGYRFFGNQTVVKVDEVVGAIDDPLRNPTHVPVSAAQTVVMTLPASKDMPVSKTLTAMSGLKGIIAKGAVVGQVTIGVRGRTVDTVPAVATIASKPAWIGQRLLYELKQHL